MELSQTPGEFETEYKANAKKSEEFYKKAENMKLLDGKEIEHHNLNQGEHKGVWHFAKLFPYTNEEHEIFGEEREALITSDKKIYLNKLKVKRKKDGVEFLGENEIKTFGLNYRHSLEVNKNFWSNARIKKFMRKDKKIVGREIFDAVKKQIENYIDVSDERIYDVAACWVIATYCYELFETSGYLYFQALRESGKSKFKKVLRLIGFNGQEASSITEAAFFRTIENTKGLLCIDEYERMDTDRKKATDMLLNAGIEKGASVKRVEGDGNDRRKNRDFDVYCPKIICNITGLDPTTQTRCITILMRRTAGVKGNRKPRTNDPIWQELRDNCYEFVMDHWRDIKKIYEGYKSDLKNRNEDVWLPVLVMAKFFGEDVHKAATGYAETNIEAVQAEELENDMTYKILGVLLESTLIPEKEPKPVALVDMIPHLKPVINFGQKNPSAVVGWRLSKLNLFKKKRDGGGFKYELSKHKILLAMDSRGYPIPEEYQKVVKNLHNPTNPIKHTKHTKHTQEKSSVGYVGNVDYVGFSGAPTPEFTKAEAQNAG